MSLFSRKKADGGVPHHPRPERKLTQPLTAEGFTQAFGGSSDLVRRDLLVGARGEGRAALFFVDGAVSGVWVTEAVARPLTQHPLLTGCRDAAALFDRIAGGGVYNFSCQVRDTMDEAVGDAIRGSAVLLVPGVEKALCFEAKGFPSRGVSEPSDETVIKGAKEGFVENVRANTGLVRRRVRTPDLRITETTVGRQTETTVSLLHIEGLTDPALVAELRRRIDAMDVDAVLMAQDIEEHLADEKTALFPLTLNTERCDRFCAGLAGGQAGLLVDGLPFGYLMPVTFAQLMKSPEDFARQSAAASFVTLLRYAAMLLTLLLPAFYLAVVTFHKEMIPTGLAEAIISAKKGVPFSSLV
ncbi:MAG: spore germination protein, partial [Oscillospiraceae bacterium]|nr:spore germination protein [Oscillospiraceae bacterium]